MTTNKRPTVSPEGDSTTEKTKRRRCKWSACGKLFVPRKPDQLFHDRKCRYQWHKLGAGYGELSKKGITVLVKHATDALLKKLPTLERKYFAAQTKRLEKLEREVVDLRMMTSDMRQSFAGHIASLGALIAEQRNTVDKAILRIEKS